MRQIVVDVKAEGRIAVSIPDGVELPPAQLQDLARKIARAQVVGQLEARDSTVSFDAFVEFAHNHATEEEANAECENGGPLSRAWDAVWDAEHAIVLCWSTPTPEEE